MRHPSSSLEMTSLFSGISAYLKQRVWPSGRVQVGVVKRVWPSRRGQVNVGKRGCGNVGVVMRALSNELGQVSDWGGEWVVYWVVGGSVSKWEVQWAGGHAETGGWGRINQQLTVRGLW